MDFQRNIVSVNKALFFKNEASRYLVFNPITVYIRINILFIWKIRNMVFPEK